MKSFGLQDSLLFSNLDCKNGKLLQVFLLFFDMGLKNGKCVSDDWDLPVNKASITYFFLLNA